MPRDNNNDNGRRGRPAGGKGPSSGKSASAGKGRSGAARGPEKKFAKRGLTGKPDSTGGEARSYAKKPYEKKPFEKKAYEKKPYAGGGKSFAKRDDDRGPRRDSSDAPRPARFNRDDRPARSGDRPDRAPRKEFGEKRPYAPREGAEKRPYSPRPDRGDRPDRGPRKEFGERKPYAPREGGEKRPYAPRGEGFRKDGDRPFSPRPSRDGDRARSDWPQGERKFGGDKKFGRGAPDRGPRKEFGSRDRGPDHGEAKPWQKRGDAPQDRGERPARPRDGDRPRFDRPRDEAAGERPRFSRPRDERAGSDRPRGDRWQEHPRSDRTERPSRDERPRRENEDDSKVFAKRPAFGGRGSFRERKPDERRPPRPPAPKKAGERIAKVVSRAGLCSRRDAEDWITEGRVAVNGRIINSPALDVTERDVITVDGKPLPPPERTRLFLYHKPRGLMTTHADPEGRPTVFDHLPEGLPRLISIGRLDFNTEGLLLLTNDGGLARTLELPDTGWLRRYRVRAHGEVTQAQLNELKDGVEVDGVKYGPIDAVLERDQGANVWLVFAIREGKNREVRNVLAHLGLEVNRLIRVSYGPFQLGEIEEGQVEEVKTRVLREQLGEKIAVAAGANFARQIPSKGDTDLDPVVVKKPVLKRSTVEDRKGRRVLVQRAGSEEARARNELEASGFGPPKRPKRGYKGKRDLAPREE